MIIDFTQTKIERSMLEALFMEQCGQIYHSLMQDLQPITDELIAQGFSTERTSAKFRRCPKISGTDAAQYICKTP